MDNPIEQVMEGSTGRGRRASSRIQKLVEEPVVPGTQEEADIPSKATEDTSNAEDIVDEHSEPKQVLPSEDSSMETSPYFTESAPQTSTRRLRPRTFRSPIKVPPLLLSKRVTRSVSTTTPRARKQDEMAKASEETPEMPKSDKTPKTPKTASAKKPSKEKPEKTPKDTSKSSSKTPSKTPSKKPSKTPTKASSKTASSENPPKESTRKKDVPTSADTKELDLASKYGEGFDWEEYASYCMRRTRLPTDPSVATVIENIRLHGNWKGENRTSSGKAPAAKKKQSATETSAAAANEPKEEKRRTKEERKVERELKKQRKEERRRKKEEKKQKKERDGETKKKHRHRKKSHEGEEKEAGTDASSEAATPKDHHQSSSSPEASGNTSSDSVQPTKSRKRKADDSETPKPKKAKKSTPETADAENAAADEEPKSTTKQRKSPAKQDTSSTALETVSESVLNLGSNSPSKRVPAGTSIIVPPPVDADRFGLIQEEVCHNPVGTAS
ncbi:hypothetical protein TWF718_001190 [Orbilia javanica]|uniref:Uncharacterized protein n=1 Tax=Orbilia javanica TaxID=47235 RepID=A0AAN8RH22_9PEZI